MLYQPALAYNFTGDLTDWSAIQSYTADCALVVVLLLVESIGVALTPHFHSRMRERGVARSCEGIARSGWGCPWAWRHLARTRSQPEMRGGLAGRGTRQRGSARGRVAPLA